MKLIKILRQFLFEPDARAQNDTGERIESMRFSVPALRVGVLEYAPGQLTTNNTALDGKTVRLYYPPESVSDKKFLKTLETAPVVVGGHDSTTTENNKKIDGWASAVRYDETAQAAMIDGVVKGNKEIAYIKNNIGTNDFGASAFVDIYNLKVESGITPNGESYNAIALDLRATHVALAQHVRDPENKLIVKNAVVLNTHGKINSEVKTLEISKDELSAIVKNAISEAVTAKNDSDRIAALEATVRNLKEELEKEKAENAEDEKEKEEAKAKNEEDEKESKKEKEEEKGSTVENAKPSQALVAAFSTASNIDFGSKTPSFAELAALAGISESDPFKRIAAVNAKYAEMSASAKNTATSTSKVEVF